MNSRLWLDSANDNLSAAVHQYDMTQPPTNPPKPRTPIEGVDAASNPSHVPDELRDVTDTAAKLARLTFGVGTNEGVAATVEQERADIETRWAYLIEVASGVPADPTASVPPQRGRPKDRRSRSRSSAEQGQPSEERQFLDSAVADFAQQYTPAAHSDNENYIGEANARQLGDNPRLCEEIQESLIRAINQYASKKKLDSPEDIARERQLRLVAEYVRRCMEPFVPPGSPEAKAPDELERVTALVVGRVERYHDLEGKLRAPDYSDNAKLAARKDQRKQARVIAGELRNMSPGLRLAFEERMLRTVIQLHDEAERRGRGKHLNILDSYVKMMKGIRIEVASLDALQYYFSQPAHKGWRAEDTTITRDIEDGVDIDTFPPDDIGLAQAAEAEMGLAGAISEPESVPIDVKAAGIFNSLVEKGKFELFDIGIKACEGMFAIKYVNNQPILVVNVEHPYVGGLMLGGAVKVRRNRQIETHEFDLPILRSPPRFAKAVMIAAKKFQTHAPSPPSPSSSGEIEPA